MQALHCWEALTKIVVTKVWSPFGGTTHNPKYQKKKKHKSDSAVFQEAVLIGILVNLEMLCFIVSVNHIRFGSDPESSEASHVF
jgi:hypothetical protein